MNASDSSGVRASAQSSVTEREARDLLFRAAQKLDEAYGYVSVTDTNTTYAAGFKRLSREIRVALGVLPEDAA